MPRKSAPRWSAKTSRATCANVFRTSRATGDRWSIAGAGGGRSGALAHVLTQVGWRAGRLDGGYKAYRRAVIDDLAAWPGRFAWRVVCGMTGTGKSRLLRALADNGAQVLDLEALAAHRGSVLGNLPDAPQTAAEVV